METNCDQTDMKVTPDPEKGDGAMEEQSEPVEVVEDDYVEEYANLNSTLDELDSCLDALEQKNDDLVAKLQDLLESSRQARREIEEAKKEQS